MIFLQIKLMSEDDCCQKGIVHLIPLFLVTILIGLAVGYFLISKGFIKNPAPSVIKIASEAQVELQADYKNPLDKSSQYVNPFSEFKNPFDNLE